MRAIKCKLCAYVRKLIGEQHTTHHDADLIYVAALIGAAGSAPFFSVLL